MISCPRLVGHLHANERTCIEIKNQTELLDQFSTGSSAATSTPSASSEICIRQAAFTWSSDTEDVNLPASSQRSFALRIEDELIFKRGRINLVVGQTGSGKTSLLMALLGMPHIYIVRSAFHHLPAQAKCTISRLVHNHSSICLVNEVLHTMHRNLGY